MDGLFLNSAQIKGLSGMLFNLAVGLILGGAGFAIVGRLEEKVFVSSLSFVASLVLTSTALKFLKGVKE